MSTQTLNPAAYGRLLAKIQPHPIKDEKEYDRLVAEASRLMQQGEDDLSPEETSLLGMIALLIEEYDPEHYALPASPPHETLAFL